jgi:hypothetical protein
MIRKLGVLLLSAGSFYEGHFRLDSLGVGGKIKTTCFLLIISCYPLEIDYVHFSDFDLVKPPFAILNSELHILFDSCCLSIQHYKFPYI